MKHYCIREDYTARDESLTLDSKGRIYWNEKRVEESGLYQWHIYDYALELVRRNRIKNVLDVGCGAATKLVGMLSGSANIHGIDQPSAIEYCKATHHVGSFYADNLEAPKVYIDLPFGLIICSDVIEHMVDPDILIRYIKSFCNKDTYVLFSTPDRDRLRGKNCLYSPKKEHIREWSAEEFSDYLGQSGLLVLDQRHVPPVKTEFNRLFFRHLFAQIKAFRPYRYTILALCKLSASSWED